MSPPAHEDPAAQVVARLGQAREDVAVAESLTGGALCAELVRVPGASAVLRGGLVAYTTGAKQSLLDVPEDLLQRHGAVHPDVAAAMAAGAAGRLGSTWALATTGVAGPTSQDGHPVGTVHLAVHGPLCRGRTLLLPGNRAEVRAAAVRSALLLLLDCLDHR